MLFNRVLIDGVIFSIVFGILTTIMMIINPRYELHGYPSDIKKIVPPKTKKEQREFKLIGIPIMTLLAVYLIYTTVQEYSKIQANYFNLFLHCFIVIVICSIFDLLVMDWLIFCTITPRFIVIPGSEGDPAYKDYKFHFIGFPRGLIGCAILAGFISGITFLLLHSSL